MWGLQNYMNQPITAKINSKNHFEIGGCDCVELAKEFGTPLYVLDEITLRGKCREYRTAFKEKYQDSLISYASKALCNTAVLKIIQDEGLGVDVSSGGELYTARRAGCNVSNIFFHGNNKTEKELFDAIDMGVGRIVVDNIEELITIDVISSKLQKTVNILFRVNPGIEAHTHEFIQTGKTDSKFGIAKDKVVDAVKLTLDMDYVEFVGLHSHIGSQIFEIKPFLAEIDVLITLAVEINEACKVKIKDFNIGGGLGIQYSGTEEVPSIDAFAHQAIAHFKAQYKKTGLPDPRLIVEPGRSIVGNAGITLYTVGSVKDIPGIRKYVAVDGGMSDNPRPILYQAKYEALIANNANEKKLEKVTIVGRFCESGDKLIENYDLPVVSALDILAVIATGAYNYSMASNYNRVPRPAMILVNNGTPTLIVKRESYDDLILNDILPS